MIRDKVYIEEYDWTIYAYYDVDDSDIDEIIDSLISIGSDYQRVQDAYAILEQSEANYGITYSNHILKTTVLVIGRANSAEQFLNTFVHELRHIENHITKTYNLDNNSEEVCYLIGNIAQRLYRKCYRLFCNKCRSKDY